MKQKYGDRISLVDFSEFCEEEFGYDRKDVHVVLTRFNLILFRLLEKSMIFTVPGFFKTQWNHKGRKWLEYKAKLHEHRKKDNMRM